MGRELSDAYMYVHAKGIASDVLYQSCKRDVAFLVEVAVGVLVWRRGGIGLLGLRAGLRQMREKLR